MILRLEISCGDIAEELLNQEEIAQNLKLRLPTGKTIELNGSNLWLPEDNYENIQLFPSQIEGLDCNSPEFQHDLRFIVEEVAKFCEKNQSRSFCKIQCALLSFEISSKLEKSCIETLLNTELPDHTNSELAIDNTLFSRCLCSAESEIEIFNKPSRLKKSLLFNWFIPHIDCESYGWLFDYQQSLAGLVNDFNMCIREQDLKRTIASLDDLKLADTFNRFVSDVNLSLCSDLLISVEKS